MTATKLLAATAIAAIAGFASLPAQAAVNLITDGNFDAPLSAGTFTTFNSGSSFGTGNPWTVTSGSVDVIGNYWQAPATGGGSVDLSGNAAGAIQQSFNAAAGTYSLQFYLSGNPDGSPTTKQITVSVGGTTHDFFYTLGGTNSKSNMNYILESLAFHSAGGSNLLTFTSDTDSAFGGVIGGVNVSAIPEPATWAMLLLGFGGIGWSLRRRQSAAMATA
jgi:choice-of-anchor C domain-containing protein